MLTAAAGADPSENDPLDVHDPLAGSEQPAFEELERLYAEVPLAYAEVSRDDLAFADPFEVVSDDLVPQLEDSGPLIGLDILRSDPRFAGISGDGVAGSGPIGVAIVDSGIDIDHPYLNYAGGYDLYYNDPNPNDFTGHGTHVAGIVGSTNQTFTGVAPGVNLYGVKVFSDFGGSTPFSVIESGLQWVIDNASSNNIQVVNMSLGSLSNLRVGATGPLDDEIATLESMGVTVVTSSGNGYDFFDPSPGQSYPGVNSTLGVGAVWTKDFGGPYAWSGGARDFSTGTDRIVSFSQRDPVNPNQVMAPGALITSTYVGGGFRNLAGTSMASPHVAGLVALLQDAALEFGGTTLTTTQVTDIIRTSATTIFDGDDEDDDVANTSAEYLRIDAFAAVQSVYDLFVDFDEVAYPVPLAAQSPDGTLIYDHTANSLVNDPGDTDTFTVEVDPGQTLTLVADPAASLQPTLVVSAIRGEGRQVIGQTASIAAGVPAVLEVLPTQGRLAGLGPGPTTYAITIGGAGGTTGSYGLRLVLNSELEQESLDGSGNGSLATAENIDASFLPLLRSVSGNTNKNNQGKQPERGAVMGTFDQPNAIVNGSFETGSFAGWDVVTTRNPFRPWAVSGAGAGGGFGMDTTQPQDGSFVAWNGFDGSGPMDFSLSQEVAIPADSPAVLTWENRFQWNFGLGGFASLPRTFDVEVLDPDTNAVLANVYSFSTGTQAENLTGDTGWTSHSADLSAFAGETVRLVFREHVPQRATGPGQFEIDNVSLLLPADDFYAFSLDGGESATIGVNNLEGSEAQLELLNAAGQVLATSATSANLDGVINNFVAPAGRTATYFARVSGAAGDNYSLVVTRNADFDTEVNNDLATAQPLQSAQAAGREWVLGAINPVETTVTVPSSLQNVEGNGGNAWPFHIGQFGRPSMRYQQLYSADEFDEAGTIDKLSFRRNANSAPFSTSGIDVQINLGYAATTVATASPTFANNVGQDYVTVFDGLLDLTSTGTGAPNPFDIVIDVADLFDYDPTRGDLLLDIRMRNSPITAFFDVSGFGQQTSTTRIYNAADGVNATAGVVGASATNSQPYGLVTSFDMVESGVDVYRVSLDEGETLNLSTLTPGHQSGEFVNNLDPTLRLLDSAGNEVAADDNSGPDSRNASIQFVVPAGSAGTYFVEVGSADGVAGEYILASQDGRTEALPFAVTATDPGNGFRLRQITPTQMTINFNDFVLAPTLDASDLTINGVSATSVTLVGPSTAIFDLPPLVEGVQQVAIGAGAIDDVQGTPLEAFSSQFTIDLSPIRVAVHSGTQNGNLSAFVVNQLNDDTFFDFEATAVGNEGLDTVAELQAYEVIVLGNPFDPISGQAAQAIRQWNEAGHGGVVGTGWLYFNLITRAADASRADVNAVIPLEMAPFAFSNRQFSDVVNITDPVHPVTAGVPNFTWFGNGETSQAGAAAGATVLATGTSGRSTVIVDENANGGRGVWLTPAYFWSYTALRTPGSPGDQLLEQAVVWAADPPVKEDASSGGAQAHAENGTSFASVFSGNGYEDRSETAWPASPRSVDPREGAFAPLAREDGSLARAASRRIGDALEEIVRRRVPSEDGSREWEQVIDQIFAFDDASDHDHRGQW